MTDISGGCLCGAVRYEGTTEPAFMTTCYCVDCRKANGAGHASLMGVRSADIRLTDETRGHAMTADSGNTVTRHYCAACNAHLYNTNSAYEGMLVMAAGGLDNPDIFSPQAAIYTGSAVSWDPVPDDVPHFDGMPPRG